MNNTETKHCQNCKNQFAIEPDDFAFYEKIKVPPPTWCPECRFVRRLMTRNERTLYKRKCDLCKQEKIVIYHPESPFTVFCYQCWWSDSWDASVYARRYDFGRSFFEQFAELFRAVPRPGIIQQGYQVNSEYTNRASDDKNCYLIFASAENENCFYGVSYWRSRDSVDCYNIHGSEMCLQCIDCYKCNNLKYSQECNSCSSSAFLFNCRNCESCFGCVNLRNKSYCIFNVQYSKEEYKKKLQSFYTGSAVAIHEFQNKLKELISKNIVPSIVEHHSTNVSGNWIEQCKNVHQAFNCEEVEDGKYLFGMLGGARDVMDYTYWGKSSELMYEDSSIGRKCSSVMFSSESWDQLVNSQYCMNCHSSSDLFGCVGLRKKQYCILNNQYSKEEYEALLPRVIEHMKNTPYTDSRWRVYRYGEFFPPQILPFAYNETIAQEYFPLFKEQALSRGYRWQEQEERNYKITVTNEQLPNDIKNVGDDILNQVIGCAHEGKCNQQCTTAFKIVPYELQFYRQMNVPLPILCPNCRHFERLKLRNPMKLWHRKCQCAGRTSSQPPAVSNQQAAIGYQYQNTIQHFHGDQSCPNEFETSYSPERPEIVYCEACYNVEVA